MSQQIRSLCFTVSDITNAHAQQFSNARNMAQQFSTARNMAQQFRLPGIWLSNSDYHEYGSAIQYCQEYGSAIQTARNMAQQFSTARNMAQQFRLPGI